MSDPRTTDQPAFGDFPVPERQSKPRAAGVSMMCDWGMGLGRQGDTLESAGAYIDFGKIAAGIARLMPSSQLAAKLDLYRLHDVVTFPGGLFAEVALKLGRYEPYLDQVLDNGFTGVEISDNLLDLPSGDKATAIAQAKKRGLTVFGEVGKKAGRLEDEAVLADVGRCLEAGADWILLEAAELFSGGDVRSTLIQRLVDMYACDQLIFELPVVILPGITRDHKHMIATWLVRELGTEVGLANIEWDEFYITELVRRGFAGDTSHPQGVYRLAGIGKAEG